MKKIVNYLAMAMAVVLAFVTGRCTADKKSPCVTPAAVLNITDTIVDVISEPVVVVREVPATVDTAAILADYFSERHYQDTIIERPYLRVELTDVVGQNQLLDRQVVVNYQQPVVYDNSLTLGTDIGRNLCTVMAGYRRKSWEFRAGYDFYNRTPVVGVSKTLWQW